jgi:uncharacterized membrane protein
MAFLLEGDASLHPERLLADASELVIEKLPEEKRPSLLRNLLAQSRSWWIGSGSICRRGFEWFECFLRVSGCVLSG